MYSSRHYLSIDSKKVCHAYFNAHKSKPVTPTIFMLDHKFNWNGLVNTYRLIQKEICHAHSNIHKPRKPVTPKIVMLDKLKCTSLGNTYTDL